MKMNHTLTGLGIGIAVVAGMQVGCQSSSSTTRGEPLVATEPEVQSVAPPARESATEMFLFGDTPDYEAVPFENRLLSNVTQHTFSSEGRDFDPDLNEAGDTIVYASTRNSEHPDLYLKKPEGKTVTQLTNDPADDIQPRFNPDGSRVAFASNRAGSWDVWVINLDGTGLMQLTSDATDEIAPSWSPDGQQIAFSLWGRQSRRWEIWTLAVDQPGIRRFLSYGMFPSWSPNGNFIAFQRARQRGSRWFSIWTVELVDGEARHPTEIAHSETAACIAPRWSPDGTMLVYSAVRREGSGSEQATSSEAVLWATNVETGKQMKLTDGAASAFNPVWSAAGRIFFVSERFGTENIWSVASDQAEYALRTTPEGSPRATGPQAGAAGN